MLGKLAGLFDVSPGLEEDSCARAYAFVANAVITDTNAMKPNDHGEVFTKDARQNSI